MATLGVRLRVSAVALGISGLAWALATPLHPSIFRGDVAAAVRRTDSWELIHVAVMAGAVAAIFGAAGIVAVHRGRLGPPGDAALAGTIIGAAVTAGIMVVEAFAFPVLADEAPHLLELDGALLGTAGARLVVALAGAYPIGLVVLGVLAARADVAPASGAWLAATTVAFMLLGGPFVPVLGIASTWAAAAAHLSWSRVLWHAEDELGDVVQRADASTTTKN